MNTPSMTLSSNSSGSWVMRSSMGRHLVSGEPVLESACASHGDGRICLYGGADGAHALGHLASESGYSISSGFHPARHIAVEIGVMV